MEGDGVERGLDRLQRTSRQQGRGKETASDGVDEAEHDERQGHRPRRLMGVGGFFRVRFAEEDQANHAAAVEAGRERSEGQESEDHEVAVMVGRLDDGVLGIPARKEGHGAI